MLLGMFQELQKEFHLFNYFNTSGCQLNSTW